MPNTSVMMRCTNCLMLNRVPQGKILSNPVCGNCKSIIDPPRKPTWAKPESFDRMVAYWPETLLVVFIAHACLYCKIVDPLLNDLALKKAGMLRIMKVDIDTESDLAKRFKIEKTPTFIVYKNAEKVLRVDGSPKDKTDLVTWIENLINFKNY